MASMASSWRCHAPERAGRGAGGCTLNHDGERRSGLWVDRHHVQRCRPHFDFLAANETLTIVYDVTVTDNQGVSLTRPVTITIIGTNDAPVLAADASGPRTVTEGLDTTGTFVFTDVDLTDHHTVSTSVTSATWSGGATLPSGVAAALAGACRPGLGPHGFRLWLDSRHVERGRQRLRFPRQRWKPSLSPTT